MQPKGRIVLYEPLLGETRPLSSDLDLRTLSTGLAEKVREAEAEIYRDPNDPRMQLSADSLADDLRVCGFSELELETMRDVVKRTITPADITRWFGGREGDRECYESKLRRVLSADEVAAYRQLLEDQVVGRTFHRPAFGVVVRATKLD